MQKKYVVEVTVDFRDKNKYPAVDTLARTCAANFFAGVVLITDGQKPDVICYSEDFYSGRTELEPLAQPAVVAKTLPKDDGFSDEFLNAIGDKP